MKAITMRLKLIGVLVVTAILGVTFFFTSCSEPRAGINRRTTTSVQASTDRGRSSSNRSRSSSREVSCKLPSECSGDDCCEEDDECVEQCEDLFNGGRPEDDCLKLSVEKVTEIENVFDALENPSKENLDDITDDEIDTLCMVLEEMDDDKWLDEIKGYARDQAKRVLTWFIETEKATDMLDTLSDDIPTNLMSHLLAKIGGASSDDKDEHILAGLGKEIGEGNDKELVLEYADSSNNERFINWIHSNIVTDKICRSSNLPKQSPDRSNTPTTRKEGACKLAVYCKALPYKATTTSTTESFETTRKEIADVVGDSDVSDLIRAETDDAGLKLSVDDSENWTDQSCRTLKIKWNKASHGLDLGL